METIQIEGKGGHVTPIAASPMEASRVRPSLTLPALALFAVMRRRSLLARDPWRD